MSIKISPIQRATLPNNKMSTPMHLELGTPIPKYIQNVYGAVDHKVRSEMLSLSVSSVMPKSEGRATQASRISSAAIPIYTKKMKQGVESFTVQLITQV